MKAAILKNVTHIYNHGSPFEVCSLDDISMEINSGEVLCICGNTGSGKSTLIRLLNKLVLKREGFIKVFDFDIDNLKKPSELRKKVGMIFQYPDNQIFETKVKKELVYGPQKFGMTRREAVLNAKKACDITGISYEDYKNRNPFELSGGEKRKIAIASILSYDPDMVIFDEPTAGLDNRSVSSLRELVKDLRNRKKTVVIISHNIDFMSDISDRIVILSNGEIRFAGKFIELMNSFSHFELERFGVEKPFIYRLFEGRDINLDELSGKIEELEKI